MLVNGFFWNAISTARETDDSLTILYRFCGSNLWLSFGWTTCDCTFPGSVDCEGSELDLTAVSNCLNNSAASMMLAGGDCTEVAMSTGLDGGVSVIGGVKHQGLKMVQ